MQEPFCSLPFIWIIQEDILAKQLPFYAEMGWNHLISQWKGAFSRADIIVFSEFTMPVWFSIYSLDYLCINSTFLNPCFVLYIIIFPSSRCYIVCLTLATSLSFLDHQ